ncbi:hypothetical protein D3C75_825970 [compost metagenome]
MGTSAGRPLTPGMPRSGVRSLPLRSYCTSQFSLSVISQLAEGASKVRLLVTPSRKLSLSSWARLRRSCTRSPASALRSAARRWLSKLPTRAVTLEAWPRCGFLLTRLMMPPVLPRP